MAEKSDGNSQGKADLEKKVAGEKVCNYMFSIDVFYALDQTTCTLVRSNVFFDRLFSPAIIITLST